MLIRLAGDSAATIAEQIAAQVRVGIATGAIRRGERLPPARELGAALGVHMHTVLRAYEDLRAGGEIDLRRGRGAVVIGGDEAQGSLVRAAADLVHRARDLGVDPGALAALIRGMP